MKKSLLALAVLGAFAGAAFAQTSVTIYGVADIGIKRTDTNAAGVAGEPKWELASGNQSGSRIGFKGSEDLGGGLSAIFTLENGYALDTGAMAVANTLFNRQAWVGVSGGFGTVKAGRQYTPMHLALDSIDPFGTNNVGNIESRTGFAAGSLLDGSNAVNNSITYTTQNFGGFTGQVIYGLGEQTGSTAQEQQIGFSATYSNGPLHVVAGFHRANGGAVAAAANGADPLFGSGANGTTSFVGGTYNFGVAKAHAAFSQDEIELVDNTKDAKDRNFMLGVSAPVGAGTVLASWVRKDDRLPGATYKADQLAVGYTHALSKRTNLYTGFGYTKEEEAGFADEKSNDFRVGVRHLF